MTAPCSIRLLGGAQLERDGAPVTGPPTQRHRLALLALLACAHPRPVPRERAMALLWPERDQRRARSLLNLSVHVLRTALGARTIATQLDALALDASLVSCDVVAFREALEEGNEHRAAALYTGTLLDGFHLPGSVDFERWLSDERATLASRCARALRALADRSLKGTGHPEAARWLTRHLQLDPYSSRSALALAELEEAQGDRAAAVGVLLSHVQRLRGDLGVEPPNTVLDLLEGLSGPGASGAARASSAGREREEAEFLTVRGRHFIGRRDGASLRKAVAHFERARRLDPTYAPASAGLADAWSLLGFYDMLPPSEAFSRARAAAHRALALDATSADAHASLGYVLMYYHWQWDRAEGALRRAIELDARHPQAHQWLGNCLALLGRHQEADAMMQRSRALAPASPIANAAYGWALHFAQRFDEAADLQRESLELDSSLPVAHLWLGQSLMRLGRLPEAVTVLRRSRMLFGGSDAAEAALARALAEGGDDTAARDIASQLEEKSRGGAYVPAYELAKIHAALGDRSDALRWLDRAHLQRSHSIAFLRVDPEIAALREEPRGAAMVRQVGLV